MTGTRARALSRSRSPAPLIHPKRLWSFFLRPSSIIIFIYPKGWKNRTGGPSNRGAPVQSFSAVTGMSTARLTSTGHLFRSPPSPPRRSVSPGARRCPESAACRHFGETRQLTATATSSQLPGLNERLIGSEKFFNCSAGIGRRRLPSRRVRSGSERGGAADCRIQWTLQLGRWLWRISQRSARTNSCDLPLCWSSS